MTFFTRLSFYCTKVAKNSGIIDNNGVKNDCGREICDMQGVIPPLSVAESQVVEIVMKYYPNNER